MKKNWWILGFVFWVFACSQKVEEVESKAVFADRVTVGMTFDEVKSLYPQAEFVEDYVSNYGVDGEGKGLLALKERQKQFFVWRKQGEDGIHAITILSGEIKILGDLHVGMTLETLIEKFPEARVELDVLAEAYEYLVIPNLNVFMEFWTMDSTRVAQHNYDRDGYSSSHILRPDAKVDRITILKWE